MNSHRAMVLQLAASALLAADLTAQSAQAISLQLSGIYNGVYGNVFAGLKNGLGGEAQIRYTPGALSVGAGFQFTQHDRQPVQGDSIPADVQLYGGFIEPRYRIHTGSYTVAPYVSVRFSLLKTGFAPDGLSLSSTFMQLNAGGGLLYRLGSRLNLDAGATFGYNRRGSGTLSGRTSENIPVNTPFESASGTNLVVRLGLAVGLGG
jgi:Outer membrane protein beta-barrel domain